jgi:hypothetical protein
MASTTTACSSLVLSTVIISDYPGGKIKNSLYCRSHQPSPHIPKMKFVTGEASTCFLEPKPVLTIFLFGAAPEQGRAGGACSWQDAEVSFLYRDGTGQVSEWNPGANRRGCSLGGESFFCTFGIYTSPKRLRGREGPTGRGTTKNRRRGSHKIGRSRKLMQHRTLHALRRRVLSALNLPHIGSQALQCESVIFAPALDGTRTSVLGDRL